MSYIKEQLEIALDQKFPDKQHVFQRDAFEEGLKKGFEIALLTYGIWKDGTQVIGCQETPVRQIIVQEFSGD